MRSQVRRSLILATLLALPSPTGAVVYPDFQFDADGHAYPALKQVLPVMNASKVDPYTLAAWFTSPQPELDGASPAQWLTAGKDPEALLRCARRTASRLAR